MKRTAVAMAGIFSALCVWHPNKSTHLISAIFAATSKMDIIIIIAIFQGGKKEVNRS